MDKNNIAKIVKILFGIAIISFALFNNGFHPPVSTEAIGYDIVSLSLIALGVWVIFKGKWSK